MSNSKTLLEDR